MAATAAGIRFIGVLSGYTSAEKLIASGANKDNLVNSINELPHYLKIE
ncbi:hypothetical protein KKG71_02435 [Patescibacteria group bacterium]|nr:hypothetical protein [Patescibacteria group bacterium]